MKEEEAVGRLGENEGEPERVDVADLVWTGVVVAVVVWDGVAVSVSAAVAVEHVRVGVKPPLLVSVNVRVCRRLSEGVLVGVAVGDSLKVSPSLRLREVVRLCVGVCESVKVVPLGLAVGWDCVREAEILALSEGLSVRLPEELTVYATLGDTVRVRVVVWVVVKDVERLPVVLRLLVEENVRLGTWVGLGVSLTEALALTADADKLDTEMVREGLKEGTSVRDEVTECDGVGVSEGVPEEEEDLLRVSPRDKVVDGVLETVRLGPGVGVVVNEGVPEKDIEPVQLPDLIIVRVLRVLLPENDKERCMVRDCEVVREAVAVGVSRADVEIVQETEGVVVTDTVADPEADPVGL